MVANLNPVKDHETVLRALAILNRSGRPAHLILAGEGELEGALRAQASELELQSFVHFLGRRSDIPAILAATDIFVLASRTEGMSNALLEAMAAGRPAVVTRVGGNPEVVAENATGLLVPPADAPGLAEALGRLYSDGALRERMGLAARARAAQAFSLDKTVGDYAEVIRANQAKVDSEPERPSGARSH